MVIPRRRRLNDAWCSGGDVNAHQQRPWSIDALMSALIAVDIDTTWRFLTEYWVVVMDTTAIQENTWFSRFYAFSRLTFSR